MQTRVYFLFFDLLTRADPEECRRADGSPQEPGIGNVFDGSGDRAAFAGAGGRSRGA